MRHFNDLRESVQQSTDVDHGAVPGSFDRNRGQYAFRVFLEPISREWTLMLGDFIYNTRASLDYLITALVRSTGKEEHKSNQFPIYAFNEEGWRGIDEWWETDPRGMIRRQLKDTPSGTKAALKSLQPFYGVPRENPLAHPLFMLNLMSNRDKHRRLNLLAQVAEFRFVDVLGQPLFEGIAAHGRISEAREGETYTVLLSAEAREARKDMFLLPTYDVGLHEPPELIGNLIETLTGINQFIDRRVVPAVMSLL
jgi:hypothetical protein